MKVRLIYLGSVFAAALIAVAALLVVAGQASALLPSASASSSETADSPSTITALRAISIPFGIDSSLNLINGGEQVLAGGHGTCQSGGETFKLRVTINQAETNAMGMGSTQGACPGNNSFHWEATVQSLHPTDFSAGPAEACAKALVFRNHAGTVVNKWCKSVTLK